ncbi:MULTISPECIES: reverse transcriptase/maturase family protein [Bacillus cereus group]|uniref:reverse transcriptase/maturase family protein n=1 Tax=Bacillus cereus group TaxID=86661 RepID=UPI0015BE934E|nr:MULTISPECIES: reverse transcriptase/maturase family protein [Bacillus cereus group]MCC2497301.1 group II intron reverse transcriptase/maturase [Bacillus cereus]QLF01547.1 group II intron reverse transcriptase/maturase [Bacillus cereus]
MRNPKIVLDNLANKSKNTEYKYQKLYRNLYNIEFYYLAYSNIYAKEGNMTEGTDGKTIDGMSIKRIEKLIEIIKDQTYQPNPSKRIYIDKKSGGKRPLGIPSVEDKLIQEIIRMLLESIYEGNFQNTSHGFRPNRSCHTALDIIQKTFTGVRWFVEGDIKGFFDNIDHHVLINILRKRIADEKFIKLIWKFLKAGYIEEWKFNNTHSGTPQGGIVSPILSNIYLNELDCYMKEYKAKFDVGKPHSRELTSEYKKIQSKKKAISNKLKTKKWADNIEAQEQFKKEFKELSKQQVKTQVYDVMDGSYKKLEYVRYADDFIIGLVGSKDDALEIKKDITNFLQEKLKLELSQGKTLITNSKKKARFLGYDIFVARSESVKKTAKGKFGTLTRAYNLVCKLSMPHEKWRNKLIELKALRIDKETNEWKPMHRAYLLQNDDLEIISTYNSEIRGFYNYYKLAYNVSDLQKFKYFMEYSMYKTFGSKYKISVKKVNTKYRNNPKGKFGIKYKTKDGEKVRYFYDEGFRKQNVNKNDISVDDKPLAVIYQSRTSLIERLTANKCEWCGATGVDLEIHHVRKLKDLKGKSEVEKFMIARKRKTLALCARGQGNDCHMKLHNGTL